MYCKLKNHVGFCKILPFLMGKNPPSIKKNTDRFDFCLSLKSGLCFSLRRVFLRKEHKLISLPKIGSQAIGLDDPLHRVHALF